ncbi:alpha-2-glucosyltransferase Alg10 [Gorgonomyces haynaldii]|nr:alpha-2-glucosyltransferase Alg10 [Gorgonomyces haynaldii]
MTRLMATSLLLGIAALVNTVVTQAYMDEIFHIPQAMRYCQLDFSVYDPKLTTPPGLYWISLWMGPFCNYWTLRLVNVVFGILTFWVIQEILRLKGTLTRQNTWNVWMFPVSFFFHTLYYTDSGSTFFVLLGYYCALRQWQSSAALACAISMTFRQTNAVWMLFVGSCLAFEHLSKKTNNRLYTLPTGRLSLRQTFALVLQLLQDIYTHLWDLLYLMLPFVFLGIGFVGFVVWNGGIVLGDRTNHVATTHAAQLLYFVGFTSFFGVFHLIPKLYTRLGSKSLLSIAVFGGLSYLIVKNYTFEHPFLLADNRHYTFYIWRYFLKTRRLLLVPLYAIAGFYLTRTISRLPVYWTLLYTVCLIVTLVPSPLLEFRYFIIPFFLWRLNQPLQLLELQSLEFIFSLGVNLFAFYLFLFKPFEWTHEPGTQRFMW